MPFFKRLALQFIRTKFALLSSISKTKAASSAFRLFCTPQSRNLRLPQMFKSAEHLEFALRGETVRGYRWNHPSDQRVLIMHGFESSVVNFEAYIQPLIDLGFEVLAFDAIAHGHSSGRSTTILDYKELVHAINRQFGPIQNYLAHSLGALTLSLFLEETHAGPDVRAVLIAPATETTRAIDNFFKLLHLGKGVRAEFDQVIKRTGGHLPSWFSVARAAKNIDAEVLFLQDLEDELTPMSDVEPIIAAGYKNFRFEISDGLGHRRIYRDPESIAKVIRFFKR